MRKQKGKRRKENFASKREQRQAYLDSAEREQSQDRKAGLNEKGEMRNSVAHIKAKAFAVRIVKFTQFLQKEKKERVLSKQILRSGTSIGANLHECINAQSKPDFISKLQIALKEANETEYWLELFFESDIIDRQMYDSLHSDLNELISLLVSSIKTAKTNINNKKQM